MPMLPDNAPALRFRAVIPTEPAPLAEIAAGTQSAVDAESLIYLISMDDIASGSPVSGRFGIGEKAAAENTYSFTSDAAEISFSVDGESFQSTGGVETVLIVPMVAGALTVPLKEVSVHGTFTTAEHCSIGALIDEGPPSEWTTNGDMSGLLTVDDAKDVSVSLAGRSFNLCAYLAYGLAELQTDPLCEQDMSTWTYPTEETTADGKDAWRVSADIAATAVYLE